ncbi:MAG: hypothetical protein BWY96_03100 [Spirochaetes bacterium ADurb.BinA120]|nr:MAG: hypothetical protein BWY96_03100 [Spirochaetes bacterium ADurb.BinA120]
MRRYQLGAAYFLVFGHQALELAVGIAKAVGRPEFPVVLSLGQAPSPEGGLDGGEVGQIPAFKRPAGYAHHGARPSRIGAFSFEVFLHVSAIRKVLVAHDDKHGVGVSVGA